MKKILGILAMIGASLSVSAQVKATIGGEIFNAKEGDSIYVAKFLGNGMFQNYKGERLPKNGKFSFTVNLPAEDYYVFRFGGLGQQLIVRNEGDYKIYADGKSFGKHINVVGSDESVRLQQFMSTFDEFHSLREANNQKAQANPAQAGELQAQTNAAFDRFRTTVNEFYQENMNSAALIGLLNVIDPDTDFGSYEVIVTSLKRSFGTSPTVNAVYQAYLEKKALKDAGNPLATGKEAPDFEELMVDRKTKMKLSDLRGKVVLLDFWASWCGPCRKENPNVVALYDKYKDKGFTVMSVSLDDNLDRWKQAIEQDNLKWPYHVSDLKKWQSAAGAKYQVRGIPFTVLIDKEGKIIQTNLRGADLERVVAELLGK